MKGSARMRGVVRRRELRISAKLCILDRTVSPLGDQSSEELWVLKFNIQT